MTPRTARDTFKLKEVVGERYEVRERLATNEVGQAFLAHDRRRDRDVELRVVHAGADGSLLLDEGQRIARNPHPGLPEIFEVNTHAGVQFVVSERVLGATLATRMAHAGRTGGLELDDALAILVEICDALAIVHRLGIAHDVIAPDRVVLCADGRVVLCGLGVIRVERELSADNPYASRGTGPHAADSYGLGVIAFEALTGAVPVPWEPVAVQIARMPDTFAQLRAPIASLVAVIDGNDPPDLAEVASAFRAARAALRPLSVVIAELDRGARKLLSLALRQISPGATLRFCNDGRAVLNLVAAQPPDVVFFDPELPRTDVRELCAGLRAHPRGATMTICATRAIANASKLAGLEIEHVDLTPRSDLATRLREIVRRRAQPKRAPRRATEQPIALPPVVVPAPPPAMESQPPVDLGPGVTLAGRYTIEEQLGEGGMGGVFAVRHVDLGKRFALKVLHPTLTRSSDARQRFLEEAKLASQLSHPNIVSVVDFGHDPTYGMFLVMELLAGDTLGRFAGRMSIRKTCETLGQIADALDVLHRNGVVHGDIKADNVMMIEEQVGPRRRTIARLIDFGLAHRMSTISARDPIAGTPEYMAPERARGGPPSVATDIYALGVVAYEILAGSVPFQGRVEDVLEAHATAEPPPIAPQRGQIVDEAIEALVKRAMSKDPALRHPTASAFRYELNAVMNMLGMARRAQRARRDPTCEQLFADSRLAQAVITRTGDVELANDAFRALALDLGQLVFDHATFADTLERARTANEPIASIARRGATSLLVLITPIDGSAHVMISAAPA